MFSEIQLQSKIIVGLFSAVFVLALFAIVAVASAQEYERKLHPNCEGCTGWIGPDGDTILFADENDCTIFWQCGPR